MYQTQHVPLTRFGYLLSGLLLSTPLEDFSPRNAYGISPTERSLPRDWWPLSELRPFLPLPATICSWGQPRLDPGEGRLSEPASRVSSLSESVLKPLGVSRWIGRCSPGFLALQGFRSSVGTLPLRERAFLEVPASVPFFWQLPCGYCLTLVLRLPACRTTPGSLRFQEWEGVPLLRVTSGWLRFLAVPLLPLGSPRVEVVAAASLKV